MASRFVVPDRRASRAVRDDSPEAVRFTVGSRHLLHATPALERRPDAALEAEAVDRCGARQRADAIEPDAGPLEAALLQHPPRGRVGDAGTGLHFLVAKAREGVIDDGARRLGGVAVAPVGRRVAVADVPRRAGDGAE